MRIKSIVASAAVLIAVIGSGVAYAATSSSDDLIKACYSSSTTRITSSKCKSGEKSISWNKAGPKGSTGAKGAIGAKGATGSVGPQGPKGDPGDGGGDSGIRVGHCVVNLPAHSPAGLYSLPCTYSRPFPDDCEVPVVVMVPAALDDLDTPDNTLRWLPGTDYYYWLEGATSDGSCHGDDRTTFHVHIRALHAADRPIGIGFSYFASSPQ